MVGDLQIETNRLQMEIQADSNHTATWVVSAAGTVATAGYVVLTGRLSLWLLSMLTARPLVWKGFDPVEVLFAWEKEKKRRSGGKDKGEDEETLQSLVK